MTGSARRRTGDPATVERVPLVAAAVCPHPPLLVPEVAAGAAPRSWTISGRPATRRVRPAARRRPGRRGAGRAPGRDRPDPHRRRRLAPPYGVDLDVPLWTATGPAATGAAAEPDDRRVAAGRAGDARLTAGDAQCGAPPTPAPAELRRARPDGSAADRRPGGAAGARATGRPAGAEGARVRRPARRAVRRGGRRGAGRRGPRRPARPRPGLVGRAAGRRPRRPGRCSPARRAAGGGWRGDLLPRRAPPVRRRPTSWPTWERGVTATARHRRRRGRPDRGRQVGAEHRARPRPRRRGGQRRLDAALPGHGHRHREADRRPSARACRTTCSTSGTVTEPASVAEYQRLARAAIDDILARGRVPLLVGGSGLYVRAVLERFEFPGTDPAVRARLEAELAAVGPAPLYARLRARRPGRRRRGSCPATAGGSSGRWR